MNKLKSLKSIIYIFVFSIVSCILSSCHVMSGTFRHIRYEENLAIGETIVLKLNNKCISKIEHFNDKGEIIYSFEYQVCTWERFVLKNDEGIQYEKINLTLNNPAYDPEHEVEGVHPTMIRYFNYDKENETLIDTKKYYIFRKD